MIVLVIGCGLIGTSAALALRNHGHDVHLEDRDSGHVRTAVALGAGTSDPATTPDLVLVAVPPSATIGVVGEALARFPDAVVTDVASVKSAVCEAHDNPRFVGGHPMAGKETSGPMAASAQLFEGRPWAIVPTVSSNPDAISLVERMAESLGAVPKRFGAFEHDQAVGLVSHIPQLVSVLMAGLLRHAPDEHLGLAGQGLRDVTRIANSDSALWVDILLANHAHIREPLENLRRDLEAILGPPRDDDAELLARVLDRGRAGTQRIPGKHGQRPTDLNTVFVPIDDTPGQLSALFAVCDEVGVNVEDVRIDHEYQRAAGLVELLVVPTSAEILVTELQHRGWAAYL